MGYNYHHHNNEKKPLRWFASPLVEYHDEKEHQSPPITRENTQSVFENDAQGVNAEAGLNLEVEACAQELRDMPAFQRHAEATTQELFFDLCKYYCTPSHHKPYR
jgi:hypothetical protein